MIVVVRKCLFLLDRKWNESIVRGFKKDYFSYVKFVVKWKLIDIDSEIEIEVLILRKRGRKLLFGDELDNKVIWFVIIIRSFGGVVNIVIVKVVGCGVVFFVDCFFLWENRGIYWDYMCLGFFFYELYGFGKM